MKKNELSEILAHLSRKEFEELGSYIHSPFFHVHSRLVKAYDILLIKYDSALGGNFSREEFGRKMLGTSASSDSIRKLISDFLKVIDEYLIQKEFEIDGNYRRIALLKQLGRNKDITRFNLKIKEHINEQYSNGSYNEDYYKFIADINNELFAAEPETDFHKYSPALQKKSDNLDMFFISEKLHIYQLMFSKQYINKKELGYRREFWKEIENFILKNINEIKKQHPEIYLRYNMLKMLDFNNENSFTEYSNYLSSVHDKLNKTQLSRYYSDLYNYITMRIGRGDYQYRRPFLELVKNLHNNGLLTNLEDNKISYYSFKQIVDTCIYLRDLNWLEYFLKYYENRLDSENTDDIINLVYAKYFYYKNDFFTARKYLAKVSFKDFIHYLDAKQLHSCIEYDDSNFDEVFQIIYAIKKFIRVRKDVPQNFISDSKLFISYLMELVRIREITDRKERLLLSGILQKKFEAETKNIYARNWLAEKISGIKK